MNPKKRRKNVLYDDEEAATLKEHANFKLKLLKQAAYITRDQYTNALNCRSLILSEFRAVLRTVRQMSFASD